MVFTNGCFDLLHPGHVRYLSAARKLGDSLVVGINDDVSVRRLKGPNRPFLVLEVRAELLAALKPVDYVVPFSEDTPLELIKTLHPDVLVKGGDYRRDRIVGAREVEGWGGTVRVLPAEEDFSSTGMALVIADSINAERETRGLNPLSYINGYESYSAGMGERADRIKRERDERIHRAAGEDEEA